MSQFLVGSAVCPLTGAMAAGTTIVNNSGASAVWIDSSPSVASGLGVRLGPKGSMTWSSAGVPAYATLDAGSTVPALLSVSSDVGSVDNPVDVGVSVALQLANQPLTLTAGTQSGIGAAVAAQPLTVGGTVAVGGTLALDAATKTGIGAAVGSQQLTLTGATHTGIANAINAAGVPQSFTGTLLALPSPTQVVDVSAYATIIIHVYIPAGALTILFSSDSAGNTSTSSRTIPFANAGNYTLTLPVKGPYLKLFSGPTINGLIFQSYYGTNRVLPEGLTGVSPAISKGLTQTWLANGTSQDLGAPFTTNGGQHQIRLTVTGSGKGYLTCSVWDDISDTLINIPITSTTQGAAAPSGVAGVSDVFTTVTLPAGNLNFGFISYLAANYQVIMAVIPPA